MNTWRIRGERPLEGSLRIQGAKNSVLPIMAASILVGCETELINCPELSDVEASINILRHLGCSVSRENDIVRIDSREMASCHIPHELMQEMRSSVIFLGAILARCGEVVLSAPGGCELGPRPIDLHLNALAALGADITEHGGNIVCKVDELCGTRINLAIPSVGATENSMLAACAAKGETVITNAACEPEIVDLANYILALGAKVSGAGTSTITVSGFKPEKHVVHHIMPDRIVAATMLSAVASAGGVVELHGVLPETFETVMASLEEMGCEITRTSGGVTLKRYGPLHAVKPIITKPYPGFPTDAQPTLMAAALKADGTTVFVENIFENRFRHVGELRRLGANIRTEMRVAMVTGVSRLNSAPVTATDLRGGAALVVAALAAEGETVIYDSGHIDRGYENLDVLLRQLGADIEKGAKT